MKISQDVLQVLSASITEDDKLYLQGTLDRSLYVKVNKVLEACGAKWHKKLKAHLFENGAENRLEQILITGEVEVPKDDFDFFPTPEKIVEYDLLPLVDIKPYDKILEPSAGQGAIAFKLSELSSNVTCYEISKTNYEILKTNEKLEVFHKDFLEVIPEEIYDFVVMNPPFGHQKDITHVNHALKFLKTNGTLLSIMNSSILWRENKSSKAFREFVQANGEFIKLPEKSFKETGTNVGTVIVKIFKK